MSTLAAPASFRSLIVDIPTRGDIDRIMEAFPFPATVVLISGLSGHRELYSGANALARRVSGGLDYAYDWASVTKLVSSHAILIAVDRCLMSLDDPAGPPGSTLRHLLAHASGIAFSSDAHKAPVGTRRIYSNRGIELAAAACEEATGIDFVDWVDETVLQPLGMSRTYLWGSPAAGMRGPIGDLALYAKECLEQTLLSDELDDEASHPVFPSLSGIVPGYGFQKRNDWGLGREIRGRKNPHWTSPEAPPLTFGHFGQSGSFVWVDRRNYLAAAFLSGEPFGRMHKKLWKPLNYALLRYGLLFNGRELPPRPASML